MYKPILFMVLLCFSFINSKAQRQNTQNNHAWYVYNGNHKISKKFGVHVEAQFRRHGFIKDLQQLLLRAGVNYHINPNAFITLGYCFVETDPYGAFPVKAAFPEHRIWEQLQVKYPLGKLELTSRFRLEQRWLNLPILQNGTYEAGKAVYQNRFRNLNRFSIPTSKKGIVDKSIYVTAYNEFFIAFGKHVGFNIFDQNRAFVGLGYKMPRVGRLELGYLNQKIFKSDGIKVENNRTFNVSLNANFSWSKKA